MALISVRTEEEVDHILQLAKLEKSDFHRTVQCLRFSADVNTDQFKLFEIDNNVLSTLQVGDSLTIRGMKSDSAVLCSKSATFDIKGAETSNTLLLLRDLSVSDELSLSNEAIVPREVCAMKHDYFELKCIKPRLRRLRERLEEFVYKGEMYETDPTCLGHRYTFEELLDEVQASEDELVDGLKKLTACEIHGYWRSLEFDFTSSVLFSIIAAANEQSWQLMSIPLQPITDLLKDTYHVRIIQHVLTCFSDPVTRTEDDISDCTLYRLSESTICRFCAELVLKASNEFNLLDFEEIWKATIPEGLTVDLEILQGLVLVFRDRKPEVIRYFPVSDLPEDVEERFSVLFKTKDKWTLEEITPYIEDLCSEKLGVGALLTKFSRVSAQKGVKLYSSRKL